MVSDELQQTLAGEAGVIAWPLLQRHFARGVVVVVATRLDLLEVATAMVRDDREGVAAWLANGLVAQATDAQAHAWSLTAPELRAVVVAPWVLVQELAEG